MTKTEGDHQLNTVAVGDFIKKRLAELAVGLVHIHKVTGISRAELMRIRDGKRTYSSHWREIEHALFLHPYTLRAILDPESTQEAFEYVVRSSFPPEIAEQIIKAKDDPKKKDDLAAALRK